MWDKITNAFKREEKVSKAKYDAVMDLLGKTFYMNPNFSAAGSSIRNILAQQARGAFYPNFAKYIYLYEVVEPLANAVDLVGDTLASVPPRLIDEKTKQYIDNFPFLDLLKTPNELPNSSYNNFMTDVSRFFTVTGNCFIIVTLSTRNEPLEMFVIPPQYVSWEMDADGYVQSYTYTPQGLSDTFVRQDDFRYLTRDGFKQLLHIKDFQPNAYQYNAYGLSRLNSILYELGQYESSSIHNLSLLENGARIGTWISMKDDLTPDQLADLRSEVSKVWAGAQNAGRPLIAGGVDKIDRMSQTNSDMDFANMKKMVQEAIYNRLQIPLALVNSNSLSLANMETAKLNLYDLAVLPQLNKIFTFLTHNLLPYYKGSENLELTYDEFTIPVLRDRRIDELIKMNQLNVMSDNEKRDRMDLPMIQGAADEVYKPANLVPTYEIAESVEEGETSLRVVNGDE